MVTPFVTGGFPRLHRKREFCGYLADSGMDQTNLWMTWLWSYCGLRFNSGRVHHFLNLCLA